jgi:hypothetical protein
VDRRTNGNPRREALPGATASLSIHLFVVTYALVSDEHVTTLAQWLSVVPGGRVTTSRTVTMTRNAQCPGGLNRRGTANQTRTRGVLLR